MAATSSSPPAGELLGVVLAGGTGRRLGRDKALVELAGVPLVARAAKALAAVLPEVVVAGREAGAMARLGLETIPDLRPRRGPLAGLEAGLRRADGRGVFLLACDLPRVEEQLVEHLVSVAGPAGGARAWLAADGAGVQPLCGIYGAGCAAAVARRLESGAPAMHRLLSELEVQVVELGPALPFYRPDLLLNVNRRADLHRARRPGAAVRP